VNTDDHPIVEFGFARTVGQGGLYRIEELRRGALGGSARRPERVNGRVDWERVGADRFGMYLLHGSRPPAHETGDDGPAGLAEAYGLYAEGDYRGARAAWPSGERDSLGILECTVRAHLLAEAGSEEAIGWIERVRAVHPADAEILGAILSWRRGEGGESSEALADAFDLCRRDPWAWPHLVERGLQIAVELAEGDTASARVLFGALADPFSVHVLDQKRLTALVQIGRALGPMPLAEAIARWEPHVPWEKAFLVERADAYRRAGHPLAERAERDLSEFTAAEPRSGS
jgi:hypothetical protein